MMIEVRASLRFFGDLLDTEEITSALGIVPDVSARKGDIYAKASRTMHKTNTWIKRSDLKPNQSLENHILYILNRISDHEDFIRSIVDRGCSGDIFITIESNFERSDISLKPALLERLSHLGIGLSISFHHDADES